MSSPMPGRARPSASHTQSWFEPLQVREKVLPSRITLAPINTGFATNGRPGWRLLRFHRERSGPEIGVSMLGNVAIDVAAVPNSRTVVLAQPRDVARLAVIARMIQSRGSLAGVQLAHTLPELAPQRRWRARDRLAELERLRAIVASLPTRAVVRHLHDFYKSTDLAAAAGFDVIQVHAAHGYLLSLLTSSATNVRRDEYCQTGTWLEGLIAELRRLAGPALVSVRISVLLGLAPASREAHDAAALASRVANAGADIIDLSAGLYTLDRGLIYPGSRVRAPVYSPWLEELAAAVRCPVVVAGRITDLQSMPSHVSGTPILLSLGRSLIADPQFALKSKQGSLGSIAHCELRNRCHYFSRDRPHIECGVNPLV